MSAEFVMGFREGRWRGARCAVWRRATPVRTSLKHVSAAAAGRVVAIDAHGLLLIDCFADPIKD
ncbi:hypothetical protein DIE23_01155 [Burkholderia sp. Bp9143]|nr:hypothetical protein DIE23_01155 [Burkholderia sp. Bp9143]